ncbi:iron-regulated surface protein [Staphylococcus aureus]|nr:iron-regulated surface protein [Staphylococcus aureus]
MKYHPISTIKVTDKKTTEHLPSDIHKTVDKTVKTKEKASTPSKENNLVNLKCYQKLEKQLQANHGGAYMRY